MFKNFEVIVDTAQKTKINNISVNTNDLNTLKLSITINQFNKPIDLTGATVRIAIVKPDNKTVFQDCTITDPTTGLCEVVLETQAFIIAGVYVAELMIYYGADKVVVTGRFSYSVSKGILDNSTVESTNDWQAITQAIDTAEKILIDLRENGTAVDAQARADLESVTTQLAETVKKVNGATPDANGNVTIEVPEVDTSTLATKTEVVVKADKTYVDTKVASVASGSPKGTFATLAALQTAFPTGNTNIYLVTADGKWYYWNGSAWTVGGTYQSTGIANGAINNKKLDSVIALDSRFKSVVYNPPTDISLVNSSSVNAPNTLTIATDIESENALCLDIQDTSNVYYYIKIDVSNLSRNIFLRTESSKNTTVQGDRNVTYKVEEWNNTGTKFATYDFVMSFKQDTYSVNQLNLNLNAGTKFIYLYVNLTNEQAKKLFLKNIVVMDNAKTLETKIQDTTLSKVVELLPVKNFVTPSISIQSANMQMVFDSKTGWVTAVNTTADYSYASKTFTIGDIGQLNEKLVTGDVLEVVVEYNRNATTYGASTLKLIKDGVDVSIKNSIFAGYNKLIYTYTVGTDINESIGFLFQYGNLINDSFRLFIRKKTTENQQLVDNIMGIAKETTSTILTVKPKNIIEVDQFYTAATTGFGKTKFSSLIDAYNSITTNSISNKFEVQVYPGTYKEWETKWAGNPTGTGYLGILVRKPYVDIVSTNPNRPQDYILEWDGHAGHAAGYLMTNEEVMRKCIFHFPTDSFNPYVVTTIKGFTIRAKNCRYCVHPESAGVGFNNDITIENCIIDWLGAPDSVGWTGTGIGIGISAGEIIKIKNCTFTPTPDNGVKGHNNGYAPTVFGDKPFQLEGGKLTIENCNLGGGTISQYSSSNDADIFDELLVKNCKSVNSLTVSAPSSGKVNSWKVKTEFSEITTITVL